MSIPVDAQPCHVPTGVIAVAYAEYGEWIAADRITSAPEECERAALGEDVTGRLPAQDLIAGSVQAGTDTAVGYHLHFVREIGLRFTLRKIRSKPMVSGVPEQQARLGFAGIRNRCP